MVLVWARVDEMEKGDGGVLQLQLGVMRRGVGSGWARVGGGLLSGLEIHALQIMSLVHAVLDGLKSCRRPKASPLQDYTICKPATRHRQPDKKHAPVPRLASSSIIISRDY